MPEIRKIGRFLRTDANGFIVSESSAAKIAPPWQEAVEAITNTYLRHMGDAVHSVYVRGTVARGEAIEGVSDIDTLAVVTKHPTNTDDSWVRAAQAALEARFDFADGIEFYFVTYDDLFKGDLLFKDRFVIKTQCACVYGDDLAQKIAPFRADARTASYFYRNLEEMLEKAKRGIAEDPGGAEVKKWCRWAAKRIIRAGFVLVMDKEQVFTRDLYPSYALFAKHYPERESDMKTALNLAINPTSSAENLKVFLDGFGIWVASRLEEKFS